MPTSLAADEKSDLSPRARDLAYSDSSQRPRVLKNATEDKQRSLPRSAKWR